ncbi:MAG: glycosyltransferase family 4 protein [Pseudoalteromonas sp.]|nr:glycosyltransferase family 4 protein [Pseudoalteromonas sp.]
MMAAANSVHSVRWANGLVSRGLDVHLISLHVNKYELDTRVHLHLLNKKAPLGYLFAVFEVRELLMKIMPDLINAHYATGYGLLARLVGFRPTLLSVWGSDVYDFPDKSFFHHCLLRWNLQFATAIGSTSHCMARKTRETYDHHNFFITPFGVDELVFSPKPKPNELSDTIVIGTVKTLSNKYGIDTLIEAFAIVVTELADSQKLLLEITGGGPDLSRLQRLAKELGVFEQVKFHGPIVHQQIPSYLNRLDIYVALSRLDSESFGVAILEASSCEKPVVVTDVDGPSEVTIDGHTGFIVPKEDPNAASQVLINLIRDADLRKKIGIAGRQHVLENYTWNKSLDTMITAYENVLGK